MSGETKRRTSLTAALGDGPGQPRWWEKVEEPTTIWVALVTEDGLDYYQNTETNETTWDKPEELMTEDELNAQGTWLWVPDKLNVYVPAKLIASRGTKHQVELENGDKITVKKANCRDMQRAFLQRVVSDLTLLDDMGAPLILHNLRKRFEGGDIYTNIGNILISINPYKRLPLYTDEVVRKYTKRKMGAQLPPHVFDIAHDAYYRMTAFSQLQSIIISGESGAGKTECTKQCLQYLAARAGSASGVENKVLQANPVLEAFGNAKTLRNDNSSRFGKYMEIFFDGAAQISGAATKNYLLEKIRVVQPGPGERNFHIFYQLSKAAPEAVRRRLSVRSNPSDYAYLSSCTDVSTIDDEREMRDLICAFADLGIGDEERNHYFDLVGAILALGNIKFRETRPDESQVEEKNSAEWLDTAARILQLDRSTLAEKLVTRELRVRGQQTTTCALGTDAASDSRHALCKFIYGRMFDHLVTRINESMKKENRGGTRSASGLYIGILDIFGFEIFEHNSFEQLCINYTNEMLQQHFNNNTFKLEEQVYESEGIQWEAITFIDNEPMIELITKKRVGVLAMLDEELIVPRGSDANFLSKLNDKQGRNPAFGRPRNMDPKCFVIRHYAGEVTYNCDGFLDKNRDTLTEDLVTMLQTSSHALLNELYPPSESISRADRKSSLSKQFQRQLKSLMGQLYATEPHYIRCIKPNDAKQPLSFVPRNCYEQLTYSGVFEAVAIRKKGFPFRLPHQEFVDRYGKLCKGSLDGGDLRSKCRKIISQMSLDSTNVQVGRTRVLYRAMEYRTLELQWSIITKHETIQSELERLVATDASSMSKEDKEDFLQDLAYTVREADRFRIKTALADRARRMLDKFVEERMDPATKRRLEEAIRTKIQSKLEDVIDHCDRHGLQTSLVRQCRELLEQVIDAEGALTFATKTKEVEHLTKALAMCDAFDYDVDSVRAARKLLKDIQKAMAGIKKALKKAPRYKVSLVAKVAKFCRSIGYSTSKAQSVITLLDKLKAVRKRLNAAYDAVDEKQLEAALALCSQPTFCGTHYEATLVEDCQDLLGQIQLINAEAKKARKECIENQVRTIVDAADRINLHNKYVNYHRELLQGPRKAFLEQQISRALKCRDMPRAARCKSRLADLVCEQTDGTSLHPRHFQALHSPMDWQQAPGSGIRQGGRRTCSNFSTEVSTSP